MKKIIVNDEIAKPCASNDITLTTPPLVDLNPFFFPPLTNPNPFQPAPMLNKGFQSFYDPVNSSFINPPNLDPPLMTFPFSKDVFMKSADENTSMNSTPNSFIKKDFPSLQLSLKTNDFLPITVPKLPLSFSLTNREQKEINDEYNNESDLSHPDSLRSAIMKNFKAKGESTCDTLLNNAMDYIRDKSIDLYNKFKIEDETDSSIEYLENLIQNKNKYNGLDLSPENDFKYTLEFMKKRVLSSI